MHFLKTNFEQKKVPQAFAFSLNYFAQSECLMFVKSFVTLSLWFLSNQKWENLQILHTSSQGGYLPPIRFWKFFDKKICFYGKNAKNEEKKENPLQGLNSGYVNL